MTVTFFTIKTFWFVFCVGEVDEDVDSWSVSVVLGSWMLTSVPSISTVSSMLMFSWSCFLMLSFKGIMYFEVVSLWVLFSVVLHSICQLMS